VTLQEAATADTGRAFETCCSSAMQ